MVERITKVESDLLKVTRRDEPNDEHGGRDDGQEQQKKEQDSFDRTPDFEGVINKGAKTGRSQNALLGGDVASAEAALLTQTQEATEKSELTLTQLSLLRAAGLVKANGRFRWGTILLYLLALFGFISTTLFIISVLI